MPVFSVLLEKVCLTSKQLRQRRTEENYPVESIYGGEHLDEREVQGRHHLVEDLLHGLHQDTFVQNDGSETPKHYAQNCEHYLELPL